MKTRLLIIIGIIVIGIISVFVTSNGHDLFHYMNLPYEWHDSFGFTDTNVVRSTQCASEELAWWEPCIDTKVVSNDTPEQLEEIDGYAIDYDGDVKHLPFADVCTNEMKKILLTHSNISSPEEEFVMDDVKLPLGMNSEDFERCALETSFTKSRWNMVTMENPEPEPFPLDKEGQTFSDFMSVANEQLSWITTPVYLPDGISFIGIQKQEAGLAYAIFGNSETTGLDGTIQDNIRTGIVVIFFVEGVTSEYEDWEITAQNHADTSPFHEISKKDNITVLLAGGHDDNSAFYRDGRYTINVISSFYDTNVLEHILRSMLIENKGILQTGLTPEDFGETIVDNFEITLTKDYVEVVEGGEFEYIQVLLWSNDDSRKMISVIPNNWRVGVAEDSEEMIQNWLDNDDPTLPHGINADFFTDGTNMYIEVRNYHSVKIPLGEYNLRALWANHQTQEWDSVPFTILLKSED